MRTPPNQGLANDGKPFREAGEHSPPCGEDPVSPMPWLLIQVPTPFPGFGDDEEMFLFLEYLFCGTAERPERGKNPTAPIRGPWIRYPIPVPSERGKAGTRKGPASIHGSDLVERRYTAIVALRHSGKTLEEACTDVAILLHGRNVSPRKIESISTSFHKYRSPYRGTCLCKWVSGFYEWLDWDIKANLIDRGMALELYIAHWKTNAERWGNRPQALRFMRRFRQLVPRAKTFVERTMEEEYSDYGQARQ